MTEYTTNKHLAASCNLISEELEAHANSRAYTDKDGNLVILDYDEDSYGTVTDYAETK